MIELSARRVLVTGGSRGIGAACCRLFSLAGATVGVHYGRNREAAEKTLSELTPPSVGSHLVIGADLRRGEEVDRLFAAVERHWDHLDCLVNNAGIWQRNALSDLDEARLEETWRVNEAAAVLAASRALRWLRRSQDGCIVNVSSTAGQRGEADYGPYAASKAGLIGLTKSWAVELAPDVRVNAVAPGWVDTQLSETAFADGGRERIAASIPLRRIASADDVAGSVVFLASSLARHITGEVVNVNGGAVLCG